MELKLDYETFQGSTEFEVENMIHMFLDDPRVIYVDSEDFRENDSSYATVVYYRYRPLDYDCE